MAALLRCLVGGLLLCGMTAASHADDGTLPAERTEGSVTFVSGGIGKDESEAMKRAASRYSLMIEMSSSGGPRAEYVSGVKIDIRDQRGTTVLSTTSDGPFLLANLPPGQYSIDATWNGKSQQRKVAVAAGAHPRVMLSFPK